MDISQIREHYTAQNLEAVAEKLAPSDAQKMYENIESITKIIVGDTALCVASTTDPALRKLAEESLNRTTQWADYLAEQTTKYQ